MTRTGANKSTVWTETKFTIRVAEYENVTITLGASVTTRPTAAGRRKAQAELMDLHEHMLTEKMEAVREMWKDL